MGLFNTKILWYPFESTNLTGHLPNNHEIHRCLHRHLRRSCLPGIGYSVLYFWSFTNLEIELINVLFSRRRPRCTSFLIYSHEIPLTPSFAPTLKNLKCESIFIRLLETPIVLKYSWQGPNDLICCGPLINGVGTWVNHSVNHFTNTPKAIYICGTAASLDPLLRAKPHLPLNPSLSRTILSTSRIIVCLFLVPNRYQILIHECRGGGESVRHFISGYEVPPFNSCSCIIQGGEM